MLADCTSCVQQSRIYPCYTTWRTPIIRCRSAHLVEIPVYRQSLQCGERSNAAFGKQSAAILPSFAPHDSKARLQTVTTFRRFMAKPCTPHLHCAARAALQAPDCQCAGSRGKAPRPFSRGFKGDTLFREREYPPLAHSCAAQESPDGLRPSYFSSALRIKAFQRFLLLAEKHDHAQKEREEIRRHAI